MSRLTFLSEFLKAPDALGSVTPSSPMLARRVVDVADLAPGQVCVELGAGTGPITDAIVRRHPDVDLVAFEPNGRLARLLRERLPSVDVHAEPAGRDLPQVLAARGHARADRVVSGLPWTMWDDALQDDVLTGITGALAPDGRFLTYTYVTSQASSAGRRFRAKLARHFGRVWMTRPVWANVPPAVVLVGDHPRR